MIILMVIFISLVIIKIGFKYRFYYYWISFEIPYLVPTETVEKAKDVNYDPIDDEAKYDDDEFLIPEDMIGALKEIVFKRNLVEVPRQTNETPIDNLVTR